jgi:hypothetical protein
MKGIVFKEPLFRKVISGQKTQWREIIFPQPEIQTGIFDAHVKTYNPKPEYKIGQTLYLKEPYYQDADGTVIYKYDKIPDLRLIWRNKHFMPKKYARYFIRINGVREQYLQDISSEACLKEGIDKIQTFIFYNYETFRYGIEDMGIYYDNHFEPKCAYAKLFNILNGEGAWDSNPLVWVYEFEMTLK